MNDKSLAVKAAQQEQPTQSPLSPLVQAAMTGGLDTEKLKELLEIQKQYEANEARKAYHRAVAAFKDNAPTVTKNKQVSYGNTNYRHASLGYALTEINPVLSKYGLSLSWKTRQEGGIIYVTYLLTHEMGHSESTELFGEPDNSGQKNKIQQVASTVTYLKRHTAFALLGLESVDSDDDGKGAGSGTAPAAPDGYKEWIADMESAADEGIQALEAAFRESKVEFRKYVTKHEAERWAAIKKKARGEQ